MNVKKWIWCLRCERCFEANLSREPLLGDESKQQDGEEAFSFAANFEMQFGVEEDGARYAECPYDGCEGSLIDFWWWDSFRADHPDAPEMPERNTVYPLSPGN